MTRKLKDDTPGVRDSARGAEGLCKNEVDPSRKRGPGKAPSLPRALKPLMDRDQWLVWRLERNKQGKDTKVPYQANHPERKASTKNSETWASYAVAVKAAKVHDMGGIGFVLTDTGFAAFDIDDCRNPVDGAIHPWAANLVERAGSYAEITTSGTGLRIIGLARNAAHHRKQPVIDGITCEAYSHATRYIVMTGNQLNGAGLVNLDTVMDEVVAELDELKKKKKKPKQKPTTGEGKTDLPQELRLMLHLTGDHPADYPSRSELFWAFICKALRKGIDENVIVESCCDEAHSGNSIYDHVQDNGGEDYVKRQIEKAVNEDVASTDEDNKVIIRVRGGGEHNEWRELERALIRAKCPVFVRRDKLVRPLWRFEKTGEGNREVLASRFQSYNITTLSDMAAHHAAKFQRWNDSKNKQRWEYINPPHLVIQQLIEAGHYPFPTLVGIINTPTMRPDGSLITELGYDPATQLWYKPSSDITLPPIPERPTKEDAKKALAELNELLKDFPFDGEIDKKSVSRSVALAGTLTVVLHGAFRSAPIFAISAPEARTGKTYLVHLMSVFGTGHIPVPTAGSRKEEEMEKRIETAALSGRPILHLNNLPNGMVLESEALCQMSTEGTAVIRLLGKHEEGLCDCRATTVFANGNNITVGADLVPRTALCRLDANMEKPWERTFKEEDDPITAVRRNRGKYLAAVFTIVRAFKAAGSPRPEGMNAVSGFEDWSLMVQQPLMWLDMKDPLGAMEEARAQDPEREKLQQLLDVLKKYRNNLGEHFNAADCERLAEEQQMGAYQRPEYKRTDLRELMTNRGRVDTTYFGRLLSKQVGKWYSGFRYVRGSQVGGRATYKFEDRPKAALKPDEPPSNDPEAL